MLQVHSVDQIFHF